MTSGNALSVFSIRVVISTDVSSDTLDPRLIATGVDAYHLASPDGELVIYTRNLPGATAGLYVARVDL